MSARTLLVLLPACAALASGQQFDRDGQALCESAVQSYKSHSYREALASWEQCYPLALTPAARAAAADGEGITLYRLGRPDEAVPWLRRAFATWPLVQRSADNRARTALWLVETERTLGHFSGVEEILRGALDSRPSSSLEAELRNRLATILREVGRAEESRTELQTVLSIPAITVDQRIDALMGLAELDRHLMRFADSLESLNIALKLAYDQGDTRSQSDVLLGLGTTWMALGDLSRAESAFNRSFALVGKGEAATPQRTGTALQCLAALHARQHKLALAEDELTRSLAGLRQSLREGHPQIAAVMGDLADVYRQENKLTEAQRLADQSYAAMVHSLGPDSVGAAETLGVKARVEAQANNLRDAAQHFAVAIESLRRKGVNHDVRLAELMKGYASVLASLHRQDEAKQIRTELNSLLPR